MRNKASFTGPFGIISIILSVLSIAIGSTQSKAQTLWHREGGNICNTLVRFSAGPQIHYLNEVFGSQGQKLIDHGISIKSHWNGGKLNLWVEIPSDTLSKIVSTDSKPFFIQQDEIDDPVLLTMTNQAAAYELAVRNSKTKLKSIAFVAVGTLTGLLGAKSVAELAGVPAVLRKLAAKYGPYVGLAYDIFTEEQPEPIFLSKATEVAKSGEIVAREFVQTDLEDFMNAPAQFARTASLIPDPTSLGSYWLFVQSTVFARSKLGNHTSIPLLECWYRVNAASLRSNAQ